MKRAEKLQPQVAICEEDSQNNVNASKEDDAKKMDNEAPRGKNRQQKRRVPTNDEAPVPKKLKLARGISKLPMKMNSSPLNKNDDIPGPTQIPRAKTEKRPVHSNRYDGTGHTITYHNSRQRCKKEGCVYKSHEMCEKCNVHLCTRTRKCFEEFHTM